MMGFVYIRNGGQRVGKTSHAFNVVSTKELMRQWNAQFCIDNLNPVRQFIADDMQFEVDGQIFDLAAYDQERGSNNITTINGNHVAYRLNNYKITAAGYSCIGTPTQIAQDILTTSGAAAEFTVPSGELWDDKNVVAGLYALDNGKAIWNGSGWDIYERYTGDTNPRALTCAMPIKSGQTYTLNFTTTGGALGFVFLANGSTGTTQQIGGSIAAGTHSITFTANADYAYLELQGIINMSQDDKITITGISVVIGSGSDSLSQTYSFSLGNTQAVTARYAILAMQSLGIEVDFDNFKILLVDRVGTNTGKTFAFGKDLMSLKRHYDKTTDPVTRSYEISVASLWRVGPQYSGEAFSLGDTIEIADNIWGDVTNQRIITYEKHGDNPTQDKLTIGQFIPDLSTDIQTMKVDINNSVQQGATYNNCSISHKDGFVCTTSDGKIKVSESGTSGFLIQHSDGGSTWADIFTVSSTDGKITISKPDGSIHVEMGADNGFAVRDSNGNLIGGMDTSGNSIASKMYMPYHPEFYVVPGVIEYQGSDYYGLSVVYQGSPIFQVWPTTDGKTVVQFRNELLFMDMNQNAFGATGTMNIGPGTLTFRSGICTGGGISGVLDGTIDLTTAKSITVTNGMITDAS